MGYKIEYYDRYDDRVTSLVDPLTHLSLLDLAVFSCPVSWFGLFSSRQARREASK